MDFKILTKKTLVVLRGKLSRAIEKLQNKLEYLTQVCSFGDTITKEYVSIMNNKIENISQSKENVEKILNTLEKVSIFFVPI